MYLNEEENSMHEDKTFNTPLKPTLVNLKQISFDGVDLNITVAEVENQVPFSIKRVYWLRSGKITTTRGKHAHMNAFQFLVVIRGSVVLSITNQNNQTNFFFLNNDQTGVVVPPGHWLCIEMGEETVLLCFSSKLFEEQQTEYDFSKFYREK